MRLSTPNDGTSAEVPHFLDPFFEVARRDPARPAVVDNGLVISYGTLAHWAAAVAAAVAPRTEAPQSPVGVVVHHSARDVAAMLGVLAAGRAYVPLEASLPAARLAATLRLAGCHEAVATAESGYQPEVAHLVRPTWAASAATPPEAPAPVPPEAPAYTLFTSGSTGEPKGVVVPHRALAAVVPELRALYGVDERQTVLHFHGAGGDTSLEEILPTLTAGAMLVIDDAAHVRFTETVVDCEVTIAVLPTGFWHSLVADLLDRGTRLPPSMHTLVIGGEAVRADMLDRWAKLDAARVRLLNTYGSTETALVTHAIGLAGPGAAPLPDAGGAVPIGFPLPHVRQRVVAADDGDATGSPYDNRDVEGELQVSGPSLALGYHNNPDATAARFLDAGTDDGAGPRRWYRTGDLVRTAPDGSLIFCGRADHQVKIRGYRVDLGEVEHLIGRCPGVDAVAAATRQDAGHPALVAFVVLARHTEPDGHVLARIRAELTAQAPAHVIPGQIIPVPEFVHTHTGKIDRNATRDRYLG
ncbi:amino acid adenylation domain-containing protein [Streptomyces sp. NPDC018045]|uniref:amino acid adenylation domain-containing protein n=1 Tax=Streptomyces sp. NPDC018045 TaxID=3365037 RepID=UPI00379CDFF5